MEVVSTCGNRLIVDAVLYRYCTGIPWRDLLEQFSDWTRDRPDHPPKSNPQAGASIR